MGSKPKVIYVVGEESKRWEHENGIVFLYRDPTSREVINFRDRVKIRRTGKDVVAKNAELQIALADELIQDAEGLGFKTLEKEIKFLDKTTKPADIAHLKVDGLAPQSWKTLIPANLKCQFIDTIFSCLEDEEKN